MTYNKTENERLNWFIDRIGKRVFRNKTSCQCGTCQNVYENGVVISDGMHADYMCIIEFEYTNEKSPLQYFDTKEEVLEWEASL
jgi:hypothetical protein